MPKKKSAPHAGAAETVASDKPAKKRGAPPGKGPGGKVISKMSAAERKAAGLRANGQKATDPATMKKRALRQNDPPAHRDPAAVAAAPGEGDGDDDAAASGPAQKTGRRVLSPAELSAQDPAKDRLRAYAPYERQAQFHAAGAAHRERLFMAGNQLGKTTAGACEVAFHATGLYPAWWTGRRFSKPTTGWCAGITAETTRDTVQRLLVGRPRGENLGYIPDRLIEKVSNVYTMAGATDTIMVRHATGGLSTVALKSYEKGRGKWQGESLDYLWFDEEPPPDVYSEGLTRVTATGGLVFLTFTPLLGVSEVVRRFLETSSPDRHKTQMTIEDAAHIPEAERRRIVEGYPPHEREARARGIPQLGSGRIFPVEESLFKVEPFPIPRWWKLVAGIDFGWDHPTAAVRLAIDPEVDCIYVTHTYRQREMTPVLHAAALKTWGADLVWAWPHDGRQTEAGTGQGLATLYRQHGLNLTTGHATFPDGSNAVEAGVMEMLERMQTGRWKVFAHLTDWFEEFRLYHRKDGRIVKLQDDLLSASRYGLMMRRLARSAADEASFTRKIQYDDRWIV
jgi:phage terminase large subunit-like protein